MNRVQELHDRMLIHVRTPPVMREWPEHLQDAPETYAKRIRTRLELAALLIVSMVAAAPVLERVGAPYGLGLGVIALHALTLGYLMWGLLRADRTERAEVVKIALKAAEAEPGRLPARFARSERLGWVVAQELQRLNPAEREVAETLINDGYEGTVAELVELSQRTLAPARA